MLPPRLVRGSPTAEAAICGNADAPALRRDLVAQVGRHRNAFSHAPPALSEIYRIVALTRRGI
jgi:hypothetical protein